MNELTEMNPDHTATTNTPEVAREIAQVQTRVEMAIKFPRSYQRAFKKIQECCQRPGLAKTALYNYPRGGQAVEGPSIRLAEVLAQNWGNLEYGINEIAQEGGVSDVEAYCWDLETNTRQSKRFKVPHLRFTKNGTKKLTDPRDIYEHVANMGARRMRACILSIVPIDVVEDAVGIIKNTLVKGMGTQAELREKIKKMLPAYEEMGVTSEHIEEFLGHNIDAVTAIEMVKLQSIYKSIKDGFAPAHEWFRSKKPNSNEISDDVNKPLDLSANKMDKSCSKNENDAKTEQKQEDTTTTKIAEKR